MERWRPSSPCWEIPGARNGGVMPRARRRETGRAALTAWRCQYGASCIFGVPTPRSFATTSWIRPVYCGGAPEQGIKDSGCGRTRLRYGGLERSCALGRRLHPLRLLGRQRVALDRVKQYPRAHQDERQAGEHGDEVGLVSQMEIRVADVGQSLHNRLMHEVETVR